MAEQNQLDHHTVVWMSHNHYYLEANVEETTCMFRPREQVHDQVPSIHIIKHYKKVVTTFKYLETTLNISELRK
jgi:hypothetical protein